jgi:hypothetical protein
VSVLTPVPAEAIVGFEAARSRGEAGEEKQANRSDQQVGDPSPMALSTDE